MNQREAVYNAAIESGKDPETALKLAQGAVPTEGEITEDAAEFLSDLLNKVPQYTPEQLDEMEQSLNLSRDLDNADAVAEVRFYDNMREALRQGNLSEPEQRRQALSLSLTAKNQYETLKEMGTYGGGLADFIEENYQRFTVADRADTRATLNNGQLTETPARMSNEEMEEAWAEYQKRNRPQMTDEERYRNEDQRLFSKSPSEIAEEETQQKLFVREVQKVIKEADKNIPDSKIKAGFGSVKKWLVTISSRFGLDVEGYKHIVDAQNIRHIFNRHGEGNEQADNQIPVTDKDIANIPSIVNSPDYLVYGTKTDTGRDGIGYLKTIPDGTTYYVEEIRDKEKQLAAKTMYKIEGVSSDDLYSAAFDPTSETSPSAVRLVDKLKKSTVIPAFTKNIASGNIKVNNKLFSKENNQLPPDAYDEQGKADINTPEFKNWFGDSKVVDENGEPLVVYHGGAVFDTFIPKKTFDGAFYFSPNKNMARDYANEVHGENGSEVKAVYISIQNPTTTIPSSKKQVQELKKQGYDGVIYKGKNGVEIIAVFEPNQIKSVYNRGTFSPESNNIYYLVMKKYMALMIRLSI